MSTASHLHAPRRPPTDAALRERDDRIEALKAVIGKLAHDFNNLLAPQLGYISLLKEDLPANSPTLEYANTLEASARRTETTLEHILLAVRPQRKFHPVFFDLGELLGQLLGEWRQSLPAAVRIEVASAIKPARIFGDPRQWSGAISHLLSNARYGLATGGSLAVSLQPMKLDGADLLRLGVSEPSVYQMIVRDSGFGMNPETARRAFDPFFTSRTQIKAAGLGLSVVHAVAHLHGGQVELDSAEGKGTAVTLWTPVPAAAPIERRAGPISAAPAERRGLVMLAADDPFLMEIGRTWLAQLEFDVHPASSIADARKILSRNPPDLRLIICDQQLLAHAEGGAFLEAVRASLPRLPILLLTGPQAVPGTAAGVGAVLLPKPFSARPFCELVSRLASAR